ncbi:MAG: helix-turn-helix domain-containing protein [Rhodobacteraceae bacterium]|nr:helix-turn-helix domain-containing protein [Paracoccaceae bacterium]
MDGLDGHYKDVRALARGIDILEALADLGWVKPGALSAYVGLDRSSVYRLINTLSNKGYVVRRQEDGAVTLTSRVARLADGIRDDELISQRIGPLMEKMTKEILWPSDFGGLVGGQIIIQASTHNISPMSIHRRLIGKNRPLLKSALGRALLSALSPGALDTALSTALRLDGKDAGDISNRMVVDRVLQETNDAGYASAVGLVETKISAIALPVRAGTRVAGALNITFFRSAMTPEAAAQRYLNPLRECVKNIEAALN